MLPSDVQLQQLVRVTGPLRCDLQIPAESSPSSAPTASQPVLSDDKRRFPRQAVRSAAALEHATSLQACPRSVEWHKVVLRDISRVGVGFFHSQQLYPAEHFRFVLPDLKTRYIEVVRCRRLGDRHFEIGAQFIKAL